MKAKKVAGVLHLWLGMAAGLVVFVSMLAAAVFAWEEELTDWYYHDQLYVKEVQAKPLPYHYILDAAKSAAPGKKLYSSEMLNDVSRCYEFTTYKSCDSCSGMTQWSSVLYWDRIYIDPYTARVNGIIDMRYNWIALTRHLHQNLLLRYEIGHYIVGYSTLAVILLAFTGLILWWPKNKAAFKQRFKIKWDARWRRVNYDVHNVGGFYTWIVILFLAFTGLVWTFDWWTNGIYRLLGSEPDKVFARHEEIKVHAPFNPDAADVVFAQFSSLRPNWTRVYIGFPKEKNDSSSAFTAYLRSGGNSGWDEMDHYSFHPVTGKVTAATLQENKTTAAKWSNSNYAWHVGSIFGWPTKVLASFAALFLASLPVTGFIIWWGRKNKQGKKGGKAEKREKKKRREEVLY